MRESQRQSWERCCRVAPAPAAAVEPSVCGAALRVAVAAGGDRLAVTAVMWPRLVKLGYIRAKDSPRAGVLCPGVTLLSALSSSPRWVIHGLSLLPLSLNK